MTNVRRSQFIGPMLATGDELATAASQALGQQMTFEDISE